MQSLNIILFIFSLVAIIFPTVTITISSLIYYKSRKQIFLFASLLISAYLIDLILLHYNDFYHTAISTVPSTYISFAIFKIILFSIILILQLLIILDIYQKQFKIKYLLLIIIFIIVEIVFKTLKETNLTVWLFYSTRQLFTFMLCLLFYYFYLVCKNEHVKQQATKFVGLFAVIILMSIVISFEDTLVSLQQQAFSSSDLIFKERNFTENLYWLIISFVTFVGSLKYIKAFTLPGISKSFKGNEHIDRFAQSIELTKRETEILTLLLNHENNQDIAEKLCITKGTLKAHIHNIYSKANVTQRNELIRLANEYYINTI